MHIGHTDTVVSVGFSFDGKYVATGSMDSTVMIWNAANGEHVLKLEGPAEGIEV